MSALRLTGVFAAALLVALIAMAPLKLPLMLAGAEQRLGFTSAYGTVWKGRVYGARLGGEPVREIQLELQPLALLTGRLAGHWRIDDPRLIGEGRGALGAGGGWRVEEVEASITLSRLGLDGWPGLDPAERVFLQDAALVFGGAGCEAASGRVRTNALFTLARAFSADGPPLEGALSCAEDGRLQLDFSGESEDVALNSRVVFGPAGYEWSAEAQTALAPLADALALAGFERDGEAWRGSGEGVYDGG